MAEASPHPAPRARILSNMYLPAAEGYSIRCFGEYLPSGTSSAAPGIPAVPEWRAEMERRNLSDILPLIPASEKPDILVCSSPEYLPIPWDIHNFPGPKILLITDWNVCLRFLPDLCPLFDFCFTDWPGYRLLRKAGVENVFHQALFGHDPARFRFLDKPRDLDLSFCGNLNSGLHGERNRLLARLARWGHRTNRPIHLRQAFGDDYIEVLNRSRLVFNYAIRAEANMRLFEAMACGAVPLVEEANQEVGILFQEGRHYFRYSPGRLEERLDELLSQPERIAEVAAEARKAVMRQTKARQLEDMLDVVMRESPGRYRKAREPGSPECRKTLAKIRVLGAGYTAQEALHEVQSRSGECPGLDLETLPALLITFQESAMGAAQEAATRALDHLLRNPALPESIRLFLRMREASRAKEWEEALRLSSACQDALLESAGAEFSGRDQKPIGGKAVYSILLPPVNLGKGMNSDINQAFLNDLKEGRWQGGLDLLRAHCLFFQAEAHAALGLAGVALNLTERLPKTTFASLPVFRLGAETHLTAGDSAGLRKTLSAWFAAFPLDTSAWERILEGLARYGTREERVTFLESVRILARFFLAPDAEKHVETLLRNETQPS